MCSGIVCYRDYTARWCVYVFRDSVVIEPTLRGGWSGVQILLRGGGKRFLSS
jgi:hypothetical protein